MTQVRCVLFDLDGVLRHFDAEALKSVERRFGLDEGQILRTAFDPDLLQPTILGQNSRHEWTVAVGKRIGSAQAALGWASIEGTFDAEVLDVVNEICLAGIATAILTNGTSTTELELVQAGVFDDLGPFFNSAVIGLAKPDPAVFRFVAVELGYDLEEVLFIDDSGRNVDAAAKVGMKAEVFTNTADLRRILRDHRVAV